ncbi:MAG TPA: hypothetical protein VGE18_03420 [Candidatus Paceibacterota bacterium]
MWIGQRADAQTDVPQYHRFWNASFYASDPTDEEALKAIMVLFAESDAEDPQERARENAILDKEAEKYWNVNAAPLSDIRYMIASDVQKALGTKELPSDKDIYDIAARGEVIDAPADFYTNYLTSGIHKATKEHGHFAPKATTGKRLLALNGVGLIALRCGNPTIPKGVKKVTTAEEGFDAGDKPIYHTVSNGCPNGCPTEGYRNTSGNSTSVNVTTTGVPNGNSGGGSNNSGMSEIMMLMYMDKMSSRNDDRSNEPVRTRANAVEVGTLLLTGADFIMNRLDNRRTGNYSDRTVRSTRTTNTNQRWNGDYDRDDRDWNRPSRPSRPGNGGGGGHHGGNNGGPSQGSSGGSRNGYRTAQTPGGNYAGLNEGGSRGGSSGGGRGSARGAFGDL